MLSHAERVKQREGGEGGGGAISEHYRKGIRNARGKIFFFSGIQKIEQSNGNPNR